ncbi:MAG: chromosomal replication initiator protein DnaA [Candidatus Methylacidiphilales bacterium]
MSQQAFTNEIEIWDKTCHELRQLISPDSFLRWFEPVTLLEFSAGRAILGIKNSIYQYWIEENYLNQLQNAFSTVLGADIRIEFKTMDSTAVASQTRAPAKEKAESNKSRSKSKLMERHNFDTYVVGLNNQFAHAAAIAVAKSPARTYNPLFIHGPVGLGKTHLMHAIGNHILKENTSAKIICVTSEDFTNEFVTAIQHGELNEFRKRFRKADILLIDDIQFFAGKDRSQEEFFHTFNALYDGNKQIVLTSDCPPCDVEKLEHRLVSRFEWGLTAELQPPDIETRLAILRAKAAKCQVVVSDQVLLFIAERVKANIRRLEGALNRVAALSALSDKKVSLAEIEGLLKDFIQEEARPILTIDVIQRTVVEHYDIRLSDMSSKKRPNNIAYPRMVAMYLTRKMTPKSLQEIGEAFGGRDHGTVLHAVKTIESKMNADPNLRQQIHQLTHKLENGS